MALLQPLPQLEMTVLDLSFIKAELVAKFFQETFFDTASQAMPSSTPQRENLKFYLTLILL